MKNLFAILSMNDRTGLMGIDGDLVHKIPEDLKWFKFHTQNHVVVMGFNTWVSLNKTPLPNRRSIVIYKNSHADRMNEHVVFSTLNNYLDYFETNNPTDHWIIGGSKLLKSLEHCIDTYYITRIFDHESYEGNSTVFENDMTQFYLAGTTDVRHYLLPESHSKWRPDRVILSYRFEIWKRFYE